MEAARLQRPGLKLDQCHFCHILWVTAGHKASPDSRRQRNRFHFLDVRGGVYIKGGEGTDDDCLVGFFYTFVYFY